MNIEVNQSEPTLMADTDDPSETYFGGAARYAHADGLNRLRGYALYERDWAWWNSTWLSP